MQHYGIGVKTTTVEKDEKTTKTVGKKDKSVVVQEEAKA